METVGPARAPFHRRIGVLIELFVLLLTTAPAAGQEGQTGLRLGAIRLTPTFSIAQAFDSNVFNDADRKEDWTTASSLVVEARTRVGIAGMRARSGLDATYYNTHADRRSVGGRQEFEGELYLARLRPFFNESYGNVRIPVGVEIDLPVRRVELGTTVGADLKITALTTVRGQVDRWRYDFADDAVYRGVGLSAPLNHVSHRAQVSLLHNLTPLTRLSLTGEFLRDRFEFQPSRDRESFQVTGGVEFQPDALISGSAILGHRRFSLVDPLAPPFIGLVAAIDLKYTLLGATRFNARMGRDAPYSMNPGEPYFVSLLLGASVAYDFRENWEVQVDWRRDQLAYRRLPASGGGVEPPEAIGGRTDYVLAYTAGVRRRFGRRLRVGVDFQTIAHQSPDLLYEYRKFTMGTSIVYGL